jgi:hypothetical protein
MIERQAGRVFGWLLTALPYLALVALGLSASYGVYQFTLLYAPVEIAYITAAAFELTYIGLTVVPIATDQGKGKALWVARGAVFVSVAYNVISGYLHRSPIVRFEWWQEAALAALHGAPLAIVAYALADLLLHSRQESKRTFTLGKREERKGKETQSNESEGKETPAHANGSKPEPALFPSGESITVNEKKALAFQLSKEGYKHQEIADAIGVSRQRVGQLLKE